MLIKTVTRSYMKHAGFLCILILVVHETSVSLIMLMGEFTVVDFEYVRNSCIFAKLQC
jgi:hypothetical protein